MHLRVCFFSPVEWPYRTLARYLQSPTRRFHVTLALAESVSLSQEHGWPVS